MLTTKQKENVTTWNVNISQEIHYDVIEATSIFNSQNQLLVEKGAFNSRVLILIDGGLPKSYLATVKDYFNVHNIDSHIVPILAKEKNKNFKNFSKICKALDKFELKRRCEPVLIIGGGVALDVASFAVSCYRRGVPYIRIPTTLMAYIDVALGVKNGINFNGNKNRIGTFSAPALNILDRSFFKTLSKRHIANGVAEIAKIAIVKNNKLFKLLEKSGIEYINNKFISQGDEILKLAIQDMLEELTPNLFEHDLERTVDFGHTFSPALEMSNLSQLLHGEAVAIDMCLSSVLSHVKGILGEENMLRIVNLLTKLTLPIFNKKLTAKLMWESLLDRTWHRNGLQRTPLPVEIGEVTFVNDISYEELSDAIKLLKRLMKEHT